MSGIFGLKDSISKQMKETHGPCTQIHTPDQGRSMIGTWLRETVPEQLRIARWQPKTAKLRSATTSSLMRRKPTSLLRQGTGREASETGWPMSGTAQLMSVIRHRTELATPQHDTCIVKQAGAQHQ